MTTHRSRTMCFLLVLAMVLSLLPAGAIAKDGIVTDYSTPQNNLNTEDLHDSTGSNNYAYDTGAK